MPPTGMLSVSAHLLVLRLQFGIFLPLLQDDLQTSSTIALRFLQRDLILLDLVKRFLMMVQNKIIKNIWWGFQQFSKCQMLTGNVESI